jgi:hypothetical protein
MANMNSFLIHISDAQGIDEQAAIEVQDGLDVGRAAQLALDELVEKHGRRLAFPLFIEIHPTADFQDRAWMYERSAPVAAV